MRDITIAFSFIFIMFLIAMVIIGLQFKIFSLPNYPSNITSPLLVIAIIVIFLVLVVAVLYGMVKK